MDDEPKIKGALNVDGKEIEPKPPEEDELETKPPKAGNAGDWESEPNKLGGRVVVVVAVVLKLENPAPAEKDELGIDGFEFVLVAPNCKLPKLDEEAMFVP